MVSRTFLAGVLAVLSSRAVVAGPCRPISSSAVGVSYSSAATDSTSATVVFSSSETMSTETETPSEETLSTETLSSETLKTSLSVPTTDVTTSTVIEDATTTTAEGFATTEVATSDATSYQTAETTIIESETTTAAETTATAAETTTTAAYAVPTAFKLIPDRGDAEGLALEAANIPASYIYLGDVPDPNVQPAVFSYDDNGQLSFDSQTLCLYRDDYPWNTQVRTCPTDYYDRNERYIPLICEKPTSDELKCRMQGSQCDTTPSEENIYCGPNNLEFSQFFVRPYIGSSYLLYFGIDDASDEQLNDLQLQPVDLQILGV